MYLRKLRYSVCSLILFSFALHAKELPAFLVALQVHPSQTESRFTFILSKKVVYHAQFVSKPDRLMLDLGNTTKHFTIRNVRLGGSNVPVINEEEIGPHDLRFTFFTKDKVTWKLRYLPQKKSGNFLLELAIVSVKTSASQIQSKTKLQTAFQNEILDTFAQLAEDAKKEKVIQDGMVTWVPYEADDESIKKKPHVSL